MWEEIALFVLGAIVILVTGPRLSRLAEDLADAIGIGQSLGGMILLGASTSLPGVIISFDTALGGQATLSVSNAVGGIAAQTVFIAVADVVMRRGPLSEEVTVSASLMQLAILLFLLTLVLLAMLVPNAFTIFGLHPASFALVIAVFVGFRMIQTSEIEPKWYARRLSGQTTQQDTRSGPERARRDSLLPLTLFGEYLLIAGLIGGAGWLISYSGQGLVAETGTSPILVGMTGMAIASSIPELVTAVSAVRRGAVALAIGDIIGGNVFDTLMIALGDLAYSVAPIYGDVNPEVLFLTGIAILMNSVLMIMLIRRETEDLGTDIGTESYLILAIYISGIIFILA
ncbi:sodium:calcium antiporter [Halorussus amylolyticus]|uniref:sodium:calcium antiporter n=1 Tax=Halorussus amylolyticus TaxID=1126242 RepID=UPI00104E5C19|nr:sodium:calcium antiporter [Halorussus amylolyticus]